MGIHDGHRARLKTEFLSRPSSFPDHKVLELLLFYANPRADTNPIAHLLMDQFGSLAGVLDANPEDLLKVPGVGEHLVVLLKCVKELSGRYLTARTGVDNIVNSTADAVSMLRPYFFGARRELVCILCLDGKRRALVHEPGDGWSGYTQEEAAASVGKSRPAIANSLRLLRLPPEVRDMTRSGELSAGHARALLAFDNDAMMLEAAKNIVSNKMTVRDVERLAQRRETAVPRKRRRRARDSFYDEVQLALTESLGRRVSVYDKRGGGTLEIEFYSIEDLKNLANKIGE